MGTKILVVDDDRNICELLKLYLENDGYTVFVANDGQEAVEMFQSKAPELVLLDIMLPKMDGWQVCREIRKTSNTPIIMLTAKGETFDKVLGLELGADDYVTKPFNSGVLISRCNNLVNSRRMLQRKFSKHPHTEADVLATNPLDKDLLDRAMKIIDKYYTDSSFSVDTFAKEIGMSRTAFFNKWKDLTGDTPKGFILNMRLRKAADMLRNRREMSISEVSYANGFSSPRYFCKCFKDAYKIQPSAFRNGEE